MEQNITKIIEERKKMRAGNQKVKDIVEKWLKESIRNEIDTQLVYKGSELVAITSNFEEVADWIWSEENTEETPIKIIDVLTGEETEW